MQRAFLCICRSYMKLTSHYTCAHFHFTWLLFTRPPQKPCGWDGDIKKQSILRLKPGIINDLKWSPFLWLQSIDFYNKEAAQYNYPTRNILPTEENLRTALKILEKVNGSGSIHTTAIEKKMWTTLDSGLHYISCTSNTGTLLNVLIEWWRCNLHISRLMNVKSPK